MSFFDAQGEKTSIKASGDLSECLDFLKKLDVTVDITSKR